MNHTRKDDTRLPEAFQYDETTRDYIAAKQREEGDDLPKPSQAHEEKIEGDTYKVHDPARASFEQPEGEPELPTRTRVIAESMKEELENPANATITSNRLAPLDASMQPGEETLTASEMVQDDWIDEQTMLDMAQIKDVLDPVETE